MAAIITHLVLAHKLRGSLKIDNERDYYLGTAFPDIRYIANISRDSTHKFKVSWQEVQSDNSFQTGYNLHSWVDRARFLFMSEQNVFKTLPPDQDSALKFAEDTLLYEKIPDSEWKKLAVYFDSMTDQELSYGANKEMVLKWHQLVKDAITYGPKDEVLEGFLLDLNLSRAQITNLQSTIKKLNQNPQVREAILKLYDNIGILTQRI